jgi:drug/metabolite transporter (DMT)-like permease
MKGRVLACYVVCCAIWGSTWLVIKIGLSELPPLRFAGARMALACLLLTPAILAGRARRISSRQWRAIALAGFLQIGLDYALVFEAERRIDSGLTAMLFATFPIWVGIFAHFLAGEPFTSLRRLAALSGIAGVVVLEAPAARFALSRPAALAALMPLAAAAVAAFANVWVKRRLSDVSPVVNLWGQTLVGSLFLIVASIRLESGVPGRWTAASAAAVAYLAIFGTVIAFLALLWILPRVPLASIGAIPLVDTLLAVVLGAAVLGEPVGSRIVSGGALILGGAALANWPARTALAPPT